MRFLQNLLSFKQPSVMRRIDIALIVAVIPHLPYLSGFILAFLFVSVIVIIYIKKVSKSLVNTFMVIGLLLIFISFYGELNYAGISRFSVFISLISAMLIYVVMLQRLSGRVNFYLLFSPALLLILSFFFYNTIPMLLYMIFAIFTFSTMLLWSVMEVNLGIVLKKSLSLFLLSLPIVLILFLLFPRVSFERASYGFTNDQMMRTSHDGTMSIGSDALLVPSQRIVMEILFDKKIPPASKLYFRGSTLYSKKAGVWKQIPQKMLHFKALQKRGEKTSYKVTLYPTFKKYIYTLDYSQRALEASKITDDHILLADKNTEKVKHYKATSYLDYINAEKLSAIKRESALDFNATDYPQLYTLAKALQDTSTNKSLLNLITYFKQSQLIYSLKPEIDENSPEESFLFKYKKGYCVHYASTFTLLSRALGIPSRVVTGYKSNREYVYKNYLIVRESDAHAWVELYLDGAWKRYDPTAYATSSDLLPKENQFLNDLSINYLYLKHIIENWVLEYTRDKQLNILKKLLEDSMFAFTFTFYVLSFIAIVLLAGLYFRRDKQVHPTQKIIDKLLKKLNKRGYKKDKDEDINTFLTAIDLAQIQEINTLYHKIRYARSSSTDEVKKLNKLIKGISSKNPKYP
ncbi:MAG: hypothetical protein DRG24_07000 [Epsilonproteobacteria bacterium]|nr:MAG: hypothetical protein DRG24_07000 [Campylobacterota bacterium]